MTFIVLGLKISSVLCGYSLGNPTERVWWAQGFVLEQQQELEMV